MEEKTMIGTRKIVEIASYVCILVAVLLAVNYAYWKVSLERSEEYRQEMSYQKFLLQPDQKLDYAFFGDSHLMLGLNPRWINNSFNFGTVGENQIITYYKMRRALEMDNVQISVVVIPIDPQSFSSFFLDKEHQFPQVWLSSRYVSLKEIAMFKNESLAEVFLDAKAPFMGRGQLFMGDAFVSKTFHEEYRGWFNYSDDFSNADRKKYAQQKYSQFYEGQEQLSLISAKYFVKMILLAERYNSTIVFVKFPHSIEYQETIEEHGLDTEGYYSSLFGIINKTTKKQYYILDYYSLFFKRPEYLKDPDHVNYKGAEILSKKFAKDMERLQLGQRANVTNGMSMDNSRVRQRNDELPFEAFLP